MAEVGCVRDCSICLQAFKNPKLLPCFHTFCANCLQSYIVKTSTDKRFTCPLCRKTLDVPVNGASGFQSNYYISPTPVIRNEDKCMPCDSCSGTHGVSFMCLQCDQYYCKTCTDQHGKLKATRDHEILFLDRKNRQSESRIRRKTFCPLHNEEIVFECDCKMTICSQCKHTTHFNHKAGSIILVAGEIRKQIEEILSDKTEDAKSKNVLRTQTCSRLEMKLDELEKKNLNKLETKSTKLKAKIDEICKEQKRKIAKNVDLKRQYIKEERELAKAHMESIELLCSTAERMVKMADDIVIVDQGRALYQNLTDCFSDKDHLKVSLPYIEFKEKDLGMDELRSHYGDVITIETPSLVTYFVFNGGKDIDGLCPVCDKTCWIVNNRCKLSLVGLTGKVLKEVNWNKVIDLVTRDTDGSLFFGSYSNKTIQKYTTQEQIVDLCSLQFTPINMAFNHMTDELIVSSHTGIYTVSRDGSVNRVKFEETVFKKAHGVAIDETGTLCISDWKSQVVSFFDYKGGKKTTYTGTGSEWESQVVSLLDYKEKKKSTYTRTGSKCKSQVVSLFDYKAKKKSTYTGTDSNFCPLGVCCDNIGNYYVVDKSAKLIHVLRSNGSLVYNFSTEDNMPEPLSVGIHGCHLWVGHYQGHISVYHMSHNDMFHIKDKPVPQCCIQ